MITTERWLVCGPRDYGVAKDIRDPRDVERARLEAERLQVDLDDLVIQRGFPAVVITGGAPGADTLADDWRRSRGYAGQVFKPDWDAQPRRAGIIRNTQMLTLLRAIRASRRVVIHFPLHPTTPGTVNMIQQALAAGDVEVIGLGR